MQAALRLAISGSDCYSACFSYGFRSFDSVLLFTSNIFGVYVFLIYVCFRNAELDTF